MKRPLRIVVTIPLVGILSVAVNQQAAQADTLTFGPSTQVFGSGVVPRTVAAGDVNGDGKIDLVAARGDNFGGVLVMLGAGDGTFQTVAEYRAAGTSVSVAIADINADGKPDLAVANLAFGSVSVLLGTGGGAFAPATPYDASGSPQEVVLSDVNGDGRPDMVVAEQVNDRIIVRLGDGTGGFGAAASFPAGGPPTGVAVGDLDGDGDPDLVAANFGFDRISVLLGAGDGTFLGPRSIPTGDLSRPYRVAIGDLNGDGVVDVAAAKANHDALAVLLGTGGAGFASPVGYAVSNGPVDVVIADLNGDGAQDLLSANQFQFQNSVSALVGNGDGTFETAQHFAAASNPAQVATGDFNGDGRPDVAVAAVAGNGVFVMLNGTDATPPQTTIDGGPAGPTNDATPSFTFHADEPATFECSVDQGTPSWAPCSSGDSFGPLPDGDYTFRVRATDTGGIVDPSPATSRFTVDTVPPEITIDSGPTGPTGNPTPSFSFHADEPATFECSVDQGTPSWAPCASGDSFGPLPDGDYTFRVRATDAAGNTDQTPATRQFTVDTIPPDTTIDSGPAALSNDATPTFTFSSSEPNSTFSCRVDTTPFAPCTSPHTTAPLTSGTHTFSVAAKDAVGNSDPTPATSTFRICLGPLSSTAIGLYPLLSAINPALADRMLKNLCS